jgi:hypothetical protein
MKWALFSAICFASIQTTPARELPLTGALPLTREDTVVFLGDGFWEREGQFGEIELVLTQQLGTQQVRFRNLAWNGDTPNCESRSYFGPPEEGFQRLQTHLQLVKPTVAFCCYGNAVVQQGQAGVEPFVKHYGKLLDTLAEQGAAAVLVSPTPRQELGPAKAAHVRYNTEAKRYAEAIQKLATERKLRYVDLLAPLAFVAQSTETDLTVHGVQFTEAGYRKIAAPVAQALLAATEIKAAGANPALRVAIQRKNEHFFHRWRPANETYLFGFRKHEQGNNAVEIPLFDALIAEADEAIFSITNNPIQP